MPFERKLIQVLMEANFTKELEFDIGNTFRGRNLENMSLITTVVDPTELLDKKIIGAIIIHVEHYHMFPRKIP